MNDLTVSNLKIVIWMNMPSHHQSAFFEAVSKSGLDLKVCYYSEINEYRKSMGWKERELQTYEINLNDTKKLDNLLPDWADRIHILPGIGDKLSRTLMWLFYQKKVDWVHWSEGFDSRPRSILSVPVKFLYTRFIINKLALGLLANGSLAYNQFLTWGVKRHKLAKLPYSISPLQKTCSAEKTFTFLFLGSIEKGKAVDILIRAFALLPRNNLFHLKIVGRAPDIKGAYPLSFYEDLINELGLSKFVSIHPPVPYNQVQDVISSSHVLVLPSKYDGWGVVLNEAVSLDKFVIASDNVGSAETLIDNGVNGFIFDVDDIEGLSQCMYAAWDVVENKKRGIYSSFQNVCPTKNATRLKLILESFITFKKFKIQKLSND